MAAFKVLKESRMWDPPYTQTFNDFAKKVHAYFGSLESCCLAWQNCYIFKEKPLKISVKFKKEEKKFQSSFHFPYLLCTCIQNCGFFSEIYQNSQMVCLLEVSI